MLARRAVQLADAGLFLLCPRPLAEILSAQPDQHARRDLLALVARAERRIPLPGEDDLNRWLAARAEILVEFDAASLPESISPESISPENIARTITSSKPGAPERKRVRIDPDRGPEWSFEY